MVYHHSSPIFFKPFHLDININISSYEMNMHYGVLKDIKLQINRLGTVNNWLLTASGCNQLCNQTLTGKIDHNWLWPVWSDF